MVELKGTPTVVLKVGWRVDKTADEWVASRVEQKVDCRVAWKVALKVDCLVDCWVALKVDCWVGRWVLQMAVSWAAQMVDTTVVVLVDHSAVRLDSLMVVYSVGHLVRH